MIAGRVPIEDCWYGHKSEWDNACSVCWHERPISPRKQPKKTGQLIRTKKLDTNVG